MLIPKEFIEIIPFALAAAISPLIFTVALLVASQKNNSFLNPASLISNTSLALDSKSFKKAKY